MRTTIVLACGLLFAVGCTPTYSFGTSGARRTGEQVIPQLPPNAQSLPRWDHICLTGGTGLGDVSTRIAEAGAAGWEMVSFSLSGSGYMACFKRPVVPAAASQ